MTSVMVCRRCRAELLFGDDAAACGACAARCPIRNARIYFQNVPTRYDGLDGPFDLLIASSPLQRIAVPAAQLAAKIVHDLGPRGLLSHVTPYRGSYMTSRALRLVASEPAPHTSPGQPKYRFVGMSR